MGLKDLWDWLFSLLCQDRKTREAEAALTEEIERLVQEVSPAIRNVRGYRKQLRVPVEQAKKYIEGLVAAIPGPLPLSAAGWGRDSPAELLFVDADRVRELLAEIRQELDTVTAVLGTPEDALKHLLSFLNNPEYVLTKPI